MGSYDREATERLFEKVALSYERLWLECSPLQEHMNAFEAEVARFEEEKRLLTDALLEVRDSAAAVIEDARLEAEAILPRRYLRGSNSMKGPGSL